MIQGAINYFGINCKRLLSFVRFCLTLTGDNRGKMSICVTISMTIQNKTGSPLAACFAYTIRLDRRIIG